MKRFLLPMLALLPCFLHAQPRINELMSNNVSGYMDESLNYSMWVEVYNASPFSTIRLSDYYFTDDPAVPDKWKPLNDNAMSPKTFAVLYFEREEYQGHANFKLDPEGGTLFIYDQSLVFVDSLNYPKQYRNTSYGRLTDGSALHACFTVPSPGVSNAGKETSVGQCDPLVFSLPGGIYPGAKQFHFDCAEGDTIYYTLDGSEPTRSSIRYYKNATVTISSSKVVRARTFHRGKVPGDIVTNTYLIGIRDHNLPVVSLSTAPGNFYDPKYGMYCDGDGTNGIERDGPVSGKKNYYNDWDRPANIELYDTTGVRRINQEVDLTLLGGWWTTSYPMKSLGVCPKKKFGDNQLRYDVFAATKPNHQYRDIQLRNSGNDFYYSMMRDGLLQSIVMKRLPELDYLAYEPAVVYLNATYFGLHNLRERTNRDYMFSNFGLDQEDVYLIEATIDIDTDKDIATDTAFLAFADFLKSNDMTSPAVYEQVCRKMDVDNFISYMLSEIYSGNTDWPHNNVKMWRTIPDGKWRWILFDTDFGMNLYSSLESSNTLALALGESTSKPEWSTLVLKSLIQNETFRNKLLDRCAIHLATTFSPVRVNHMIDSLAAKIQTEILYHKAIYPSFRSLASDIGVMKTFAATRPNYMFSHFANRLLNSGEKRNLALSSNVSGASYTLNDELVPDANLTIPYYYNRSIRITAAPVRGYTFSHWEKADEGSTATLLPMGAVWKYFDGSYQPAVNWNTSSYSDALWATGYAPLGYGGRGHVTAIGYGGNTNAKYPTSYYRYTLNISNKSTKTDFTISTLADDGIIVYVNGTEVGRANMPSGAVTFNTYSSSSNNGITSTFTVPAALIKEGSNLISAEVHQCNATSSDVIFDLSMSCTESQPSVPVVLKDPVFSEVLVNPINLKAIYSKDANPDTARKTVVINEVVASNKAVEDEYGEKDDYVELYNYGDEAVDVAGWNFSDTPAFPALTTIPALSDGKTLVPPKGWLVLWADDTPAQGPLHMPFKLSKDGESLVLSRIDSYNQRVVEDSVTFPYLDENLSYARVTDASPFWIIQPHTWMATNNLGTGVEKPAMPVEAGFKAYPNPFAETLTCADAPEDEIVLFDLTGRLVRRFLRTGFETQIQAGDLPSGLYLLRSGSACIKVRKQ